MNDVEVLNAIEQFKMNVSWRPQRGYMPGAWVAFCGDKKLPSHRREADTLNKAVTACLASIERALRARENEHRTLRTHQNGYCFQLGKAA